MGKKRKIIFQERGMKYVKERVSVLVKVITEIRPQSKIKGIHCSRCTLSTEKEEGIF